MKPKAARGVLTSVDSIGSESVQKSSTRHVSWFDTCTFLFYISVLLCLKVLYFGFVFYGLSCRLSVTSTA